MGVQMIRAALRTTHHGTDAGTSKARSSQALSALAVAVLAGAPLAPLAALASLAPLASLGAQQRTQDVTNVTRISVGIFRSADKTAGVQAADAIRTRLAEEYPIKQLYVLPKQDVVNVLESSGFPTNEALTAADARALAQQLRTDAYVVGTIQRDSGAAGGYRVDANYVLTRDNSLVQPLPTIRVSKPDQAAGPVVKAFKDAHKQFADEKSCYTAARAGKWADAIAAARRGIAAYPNATLSRICLANAFVGSKAPADSVVAVANEILKIDPRSRPALTIAYDALKTAGKNAEATDMLLRLVGADPTNARLLEQVVNELALAGEATKAMPFVDQLVRDNPGDPSFLLLQTRVHLAAKDYKGGIAAGEELMKTDTASVTAELITRLAAAASIDSQPQKAAELLARGLAKFPANADLMTMNIAVLQQSGQSQKALESLDKAIASGVKIPGLRTQQAKIYADMNQPDKAMEILQGAVAAGDSAASVAQMALYASQGLQKAASASKAIADFQKALSFLDFSIKTNSTPDALLRRTALNLSLAGAYLTQAQAQSSQKGAKKADLCATSKAAQDALNVAQTDLPQAGRANAQAAQALAPQLTQFAGYADQFVRLYCSGK
jgi:tetratricopeptide (TPR) repeat protein